MQKAPIVVGRRKTSVARVRLIPGAGQITVNSRPFENYFPIEHHRQEVLKPLEVTDSIGKYDVVANVRGGGISGQAGAVRLGIARALVSIDESVRETLKKSRLLTRDPRMVERKKYGQPKARKRYQYSKR